jgi:hypothetical protein
VQGLSSYAFSPLRDGDLALHRPPLVLTRHDGRTDFILEDPGGELLDRVLEHGNGQSLELTRFGGRIWAAPPVPCRATIKATPPSQGTEAS